MAKLCCILIPCACRLRSVLDFVQGNSAGYLVSPCFARRSTCVGQTNQCSTMSSPGFTGCTDVCDACMLTTVMCLTGVTAVSKFIVCLKMFHVPTYSVTAWVPRAFWVLSQRSVAPFKYTSAVRACVVSIHSEKRLRVTIISNL